MLSVSERRTSRRFSMTLPLKVYLDADQQRVGREAHTRDVSFRGLYFLLDANLDAGSNFEFILTLPREITLAGDVHIRCTGLVVRVDEFDGRRGIAARIDHFDFLPAPA